MAGALPGVTSLGDVSGKRVLVRSDLNVPLDGETITDDGRIRASVPQIRALLDAGADVVVCAHLGRPKGAPDPKYSLRPVAARLGQLLDRDVEVLEDPEGTPKTGLALLACVRFRPGGTSKDDAERGAYPDVLAGLADAYVYHPFGAVSARH